MDNEITTKNLLNVIDFEIAKFDNEVSRAGWNFWILLASLASLSWVLLEELESNQQDWHYSFFVFLAASLILEAIGNLRALLTSANQFAVVNRFYMASVYFGSLRISYMFVVLRNLVLLVITFFLQDILDFYWLIFSFYGVYTFVALLILVGSFLDVPIKVKKDKKINFASLLITSLCIFFLGAMLSDIASGILVINIAEYKIGFALFGISFLASSILTVVQSPYHKDRLVEIRRDFLLGNMGFEETKRQVEILLIGMQVADFVNDEIKEVMKILQEQNRIFSREHQKYEEVFNDVSLLDFKKIKREKLSVALKKIVNLMDSAKEDTSEAMRLSKELDSQISKLNVKISRLGPDATLEKTLQEKINQAFEMTHQKMEVINQYHVQLESLKKPIEDRVSELARK